MANWTPTRDWADGTGQQVNAAFLDSLEAFLASLNSAATQNQTDNYLLDRTHHTGEQTMSTVTGLEAELAKTDAVLYYGASAVPLRATRTTDATRPVRWRGTTAPPTTTGYALAIDIWEQTA